MIIKYYKLYNILLNYKQLKLEISLKSMTQLIASIYYV